MAHGDTRKDVEEFVKELMAAIQKSTFYGTGHDLTKASVNALEEKLAAVFTQQPDLTIGIVGDEVAFEKEPFYELSRNIRTFIARLQEMKIEKISFAKGVEKKELTDFLGIFVKDPKSARKAETVEEALASRGITNIMIESLGAGSGEQEDQSPEELFGAVKDNFQEGMDYLKSTLDDISNNRAIDIKAARFFISKLISNLLKNKDLLLILTTLKKQDDLTFVHSMNVSILTLAQAESLGIEQSLLSDIGIAALLHDTGKLALEGKILKKGKELNPEEIEKVRSHPADGAKILLETPGLPPLAALAAFEHHLRYDRKGYPTRLYSKQTNLVSMMVTIADVYDAIRNKRHYHEARVPEEVYDEMMKLSGGYLHPVLLEIFFKTIGVYPPGTLVELDTGVVGLVVKESFLDIKRPFVEILYNTKGKKEGAPHIANLMEKKSAPDVYKRTIVRSLAVSEKFEIPEKYRAG